MRSNRARRWGLGGAVGGVVALSLGAISSESAPGEPPKARVAWETSLRVAQEKAVAEKRPLFIAVNMDGEAANDRMARDVYSDAKVLALSKRTVNVVASRFDHRSGSQPCPRFGTIRCDEHRRIDVDARRQVLKAGADGWVIAPQHVFLKPDGTPILSVVYEIDARELEWCFRAALLAVDPDAELEERDLKPPRRLFMGEIPDPEALDERGDRVGKKDLLESLADAEHLPSGSREALVKKAITTDRADALAFVDRELTRRLEEAKTAEEYEAVGLLVRQVGESSPSSYWTVLAPRLTHEQPTIRLEVAVALEQLACVDALSAVRKADSREKNADVRKGLIRAMGVVGRGDKKAIRDLQKVARDDDDVAIRCNAIVALGSVTADTAVRKDLEGKLRNGGVTERKAAACAMAISRDIRWKEELEQRFSIEKKHDVRKAIENALKVLAGETLQLIRKEVRSSCRCEIPRRRIFGPTKGS